MALIFFTKTPILKAFLPTLLYGFFTILITLFAGAIFDTSIITTEVSRFYRGYDLGSITSGKMLL
jgi:hypothetical protein